MKTTMLWLGWVWMALSGPGQAQAPAERMAPPELASFFSSTSLRRATLSPSGRWLAALAALPGRRVGLQITDLEGVEAPRHVETSTTDDVAWFRWVDDDWLLFTLRDAQPRRGIWRGPGLLAMRRDGSDVRQLVARGWNDVPRGTLSPAYGYMALGKPGSLDVIVGTGHGDVVGEYTHTSLLAVNIVTKAWRRIHDDAPRASAWWFDHLGRPRLITQEDDKETKVLWAQAEGDRVGPWREIARMPLLHGEWTPAYVEGDDQLVVATFDAQGYSELRRFDFATGKPAGAALVATPGFTTGFAIRRKEQGGAAIGVDVTVDAFTTEWFTPEMKALQDRVDARWPGRVNVLQCRPCDKPRVVLVYSYADNDPGRYLLYRPDTDKWLFLADVQPDIDPARMARTEFLRLRSRDGGDLPVWVTRPPGTSAAAPAVVLVHGGPHTRGAQWAWDPEVQFLASRGYVVIQPEFRGSTGYGREHYRAGWKQWGTGMIDDITDALRHVQARGWADPKRACIMGSSYGGYAVLMSLVREPALYRCGIAHAAVTDLRDNINFHWSDLSAVTRRVVLPLTMGDPKKDAEMMIASSPVEQAARIQAPVLLMHGDDDVRVPIEHGERMHAALKKAGKEVEWVVYVDEGHGFWKRDDLLDHWKRVERFLGRHLR